MSTESSPAVLHFYRPLAIDDGATWKYAGICTERNREWFQVQCRSQAEYPFLLGCEIVPERLNDHITAVQIEALKRVAEMKSLERQILQIENCPSNVEGGLKAWNSGRPTVLKSSAKSKLDRLNRQLDNLLDQVQKT